ncbi:hypothetical protein CC85DRAFT_311628 [Cutaneotrichosporon oleaginosum]|uniref:SMP domain-containing protein n=1 Tax=Cutaneotrichosporon oleaginosum TaxID=879819 RepID=A0A0J0XRF2_9TREE|nr:uncharacterized protein CC85DRAFT_311628 [Cutaneotrichosporon oleaginosum]KLT43673.1 hypothetical protein CC85DRAFT_311628 [Cutaneotrichosporon oleaginosum]TXT12663.1 hypothetical protein COLE_03073 [Cutaneotrichosporon oleaginosum]
MAAAALRPMMAVAREEAAVVASEASMAARTTVGTEAKTLAREMGHEVLNPVAIREAAEANAKRALDMTEQPNLFGVLSHAKPSGTPTLTTSTSTTASTAISETSSALAEHNLLSELGETTINHNTSYVAQLLEADLGVTVREAMTNGAETGMQDVAEQAAELAKNVVNGNVQLDRRVKALAKMPPPQA